MIMHTSALFETQCSKRTRRKNFRVFLGPCCNLIGSWFLVFTGSFWRESFCNLLVGNVHSSITMGRHNQPASAHSLETCWPCILGFPLLSGDFFQGDFFQEAILQGVFSGKVFSGRFFLGRLFPDTRINIYKQLNWCTKYITIFRNESIYFVTKICVYATNNSNKGSYMFR